jgi:thymidylate synthase (FAD)
MPAVFYVPELDRIRYQHATNKQMSGEPMDEAEARRAQQDIHNASLYAYDEYERLLDMGVSRELARVVLPLNMYTRWVWKCDLHNILNFLKLRMAEDAQPEIRAYAFGIAHFVRREFPNVWQAFVEKHQIDLTDDPSEP